jgi:hypothetical protein
VLKIVFINIVDAYIVPNVTASHTYLFFCDIAFMTEITSSNMDHQQRVPLGCFGASWHDISSQSKDALYTCCC